MLASSAASWAPSAIVWPTYGVREKGALTAISSVLSAPLDPSPPQAERRTQRARRRSSRFKTGMLERLAAQVGGSHGLVRRDLLERAGCDSPSGLEDRHDVGHAPDEPQVVLDDEEAESPVAERSQEVGQPLELDRGRAGGRLVEEQDARLRR